jgi:hypothetical protein
MEKLKIYYDKNTSRGLTIIEPSGKIHSSETVEMGKNMLDMNFLKKYIGKEVELYVPKHPLSSFPVLESFEIDENNIHCFGLSYQGNPLSPPEEQL